MGNLSTKKSKKKIINKKIKSEGRRNTKSINKKICFQQKETNPKTLFPRSRKARNQMIQTSWYRLFGFQIWFPVRVMNFNSSQTKTSKKKKHYLERRYSPHTHTHARTQTHWSEPLPSSLPPTFLFK
jgi:hypothetical protein